MTEKVLITGTTGFMGRHLVKLLRKEGYEILGLDKLPPPPEEDIESHVMCDLLDLNKLKVIVSQFNPTMVIHLAARTDLDENEKLSGYASNIEGTENLVTAIEYTGNVKRALFTSSQLVCKVGYIPETDETYVPSNLYGESKVLTEKIVRKSKLSGVTWCLLRPTTIWGEGMSLHYQRFLRLVKKGRFFHIGKGPLYKSYGYIENSIFQYLQFLRANGEAIHGKTFYIADYQPLSLRNWINELALGFEVGKVKTLPVLLARKAALVGDVLNFLGFRRFPFNTFRVNNILTEYIFDMAPTEEVCGPLPFSEKEGVVKTVKWFKDVQ